MVSLKDMANTSGVMGVFILVNLRMELSREKGNGRKIIYLILIATKVSITWIRSMAMVFLNGRLEIPTKEITKMI